MVKIVFLLSQSLNSPSGLGRYGPLAKELAKLGHKVEVIALHPDFDHLDRKENSVDGVPVHYVAQMHVKKSGDTKSYFSNTQLLKIVWSATWQLTRAVLASEPELVIIGKPHPMNSIAGLVARFIKRCEIILDCDDYEAASGRFGSAWQKSIISWFEKWMPHRAKFVTTNTQFMRKKLMSWGILEDKIVYMPNGIDQARFTTPNPNEVKSLRKELALDEWPIIGYIGSLSLASHPVDLLVKAFNQLVDLEVQVVLMLVGGGEDLQNLKDLTNSLGLSRFIKFCGRVPPDRIPLYYSLMDVSVDPVYDNDAARGRSPLKLFESWACGVPFVSGDVGDRSSLLGDPPAGILAKPGSPDELAEAIKSILGDPDLADELRSRGLERVPLFTWNHLASSFDDQILRQLSPSSS